MDRARHETIAGRLLLGFLGALVAGVAVAVLGWLLHESFSAGCTIPAPNARLGELYLVGYNLLELVTLVAAVVCGVLFLRTERRLGRSHEIATSLGLLASLGLAAVELWYAVLTQLAIHPICW